jgi:hypothetical protein
MQELRSIETNVLLDMLASYTAEYLRIDNDPAKETEYAKCMLTLRAIQAEIEARKQNSSNTSSTDPSISLQR